MNDLDRNLQFNLHKAYSDIGITDGDEARLATVYGAGQDELRNILRGFERENEANAAAVLAGHGEFAPVTDRQVKIAYLGDSITSDRISHRCIIEKILAPYKNLIVRDLSVSGFKSYDVLVSLYPEIHEFMPDISVMMIGTNDMRMCDDEYRLNTVSPGEYERNLDYIIRKLHGFGSKLILCTLPPFQMEKMEAEMAERHNLYTVEALKIYDDIIIKIAEKHSAQLVDMRPVYAKENLDEIIMSDGLHLNGAGQTLLAKNVFSYLAKMLEK